METFKSKGLTRDDLRETMRLLADRRTAETPQRGDPAWMSAAYGHAPEPARKAVLS